MSAATDPTSVYLYFDARGVLLYVGITKRGGARQAEHNERAEWWTFVAKQEIEHYESRDIALARETLLIRTNRPPFNKQHNPDHARLKDAYYVLFGPTPTPPFDPDDRDACLDCDGNDPSCEWPDGDIEAKWRANNLVCADPECDRCHAKYHGYDLGWGEGYDDGLSMGNQVATDRMLRHAVPTWALEWVIDDLAVGRGGFITGPDSLTELARLSGQITVQGQVI